MLLVIPLKSIIYVYVYVKASKHRVIVGAGAVWSGVGTLAVALVAKDEARIRWPCGRPGEIDIRKAPPLFLA
jgi:hypothetical protein